MQRNRRYFVSLVYVFIASIILKVKSLSDDLYNTHNISSDLNWKKKDGESEWSEVSAHDAQHNTIRTYQICPQPPTTKSDGHWLRSPYIQARGAKRVKLEITFSVVCFNEENCRETFTVYNYQADSDEATSTFPPWNDSLYDKMDTLAADKNLNRSKKGKFVVTTKVLEISPLKRKGLYIAINNQGACLSIQKIRIFYNYCPQITRDLVTFSETVSGAGHADLVKVEGSCLSNSVKLNKAPVFYCNSNGEWKASTGSCYCDVGYQYHQNGSCIACQPGFYKSAVGNEVCKKCPDLSFTDSFASSFCQCSVDSFRLDGNKISQSCKRTPSEPQNIKINLKNNRAQIVWQPPLNDGGIKDISYSVSCSKCTDETYTKCKMCPNSIKFYPNNYKNLISPEVLMSDLLQFSYYKLKIKSINGVSKKSNKPEKFAEIQFSTSESVPSEVVGLFLGEINYNSVQIYWSKPRNPNQPITEYEITLKPTNQQQDSDGFVSIPTTHKVKCSSSSCNITLSALLQSSTYQVKVRAHNKAGFGKFSKTKTFTTESKPVTEISFPILVAIVVCTSAVILITFIYCLICLRKKIHSKPSDTKTKMLDSSLTTKMLDSSLTTKFGDLRVDMSQHGRHKTYVDYRDPHRSVKEVAREIEVQQIKILKVIGQGEFGEVCRGEMKQGKKKCLDVAVKTLKKGASLVDQTNFLREACTMAQFDHPNVVKLIGVVTKQVPTMIVTEFVQNGSLDKFLLTVSKEQINLSEMVTMMHGISSGMKYLHSMNYIHRDLAARNVLVDHNFKCKVSDFGLSRKTLENDPNATYTTQGGKIALRWTAPECIRYRKFTSASDVWSFGIVMWEVTSFGEKPYWDMNNDDVTDVIEDGYRLPCPEGCPVDLHETMLRCWSYDPRKRPDFTQLIDVLGGHVMKIESCSPVPSSMSTCDSTRPLLLNQSSLESLPLHASSLDEWLDFVQLDQFKGSFYANGINDLQTLSKLNINDLEKLGIVPPERRNFLQNEIETLRFRYKQRFTSPTTPSNLPLPLSVAKLRQQRPPSGRNNRSDHSVALV